MSKVSVEDRIKFVGRFMASGMTQEAYCREYGFSPRTLKRWKEALGVLDVGDKVLVTATDEDLRDYFCAPSIKTGGVYEIERVSTTTRKGKQKIMYSLAVDSSASWVLQDFVVPAEEDFLSVGQRVRITATDEQLRKFYVSPEFKSGGEYEITAVDKAAAAGGFDCGTYLLQDHSSGWVQKGWVVPVESEEVAEDTVEETGKLFVKIVGSEDDLRAQEVHRVIETGGIYEVNFIDDYDGYLNLKTEPQYTTTNVSPDIIEYVKGLAPKKSLRDVEKGDSLRVIAIDKELRDFKCNPLIKTGEVYKVLSVNTKCGFEKAAPEQGTFRLDIDAWDSWVRPEMVEVV